MKVSICISVGIYPCHTFVIVGDCLDESMTRWLFLDFIYLIRSDRSPVTIIWSAIDPVSFVDSIHVFFLSFHDVVSYYELIRDVLLQSVLKVVSCSLYSWFGCICLYPLILREEGILCPLRSDIISIRNIRESLSCTWHDRIIVGSLIENLEEFLRKNGSFIRSEKSLKVTRCIVEWRWKVYAGIWRYHYTWELHFKRSSSLSMSSSLSWSTSMSISRASRLTLSHSFRACEVSFILERVCASSDSSAFVIWFLVLFE